MKNQYYADSRDVWKWTATRMAAETGIYEIVQVAMLTSDDLSRQGRQRNDPPNADPTVAQFFSEEREIISRHPPQRRIERISDLGLRFGPRLTIEVVTDPFRNGEREQYFLKVTEKIRDIHRPIIGFLDPDIGLEPTNPDARHVKVDEVRLVWRSLAPESLVSAFQYQRQGIPGWVSSAMEQFAKGLGGDSYSVNHLTWSSASMLFARKHAREAAAES